MSEERVKLNWFRVRKVESLAHLPAWVRSQPVNTFTGARTDKKGDWIILLGWDDKPDSDWGKFRGNRAAVWFASGELADAGENAIRKGLGWPAEDKAQ